MSRKTFHHGDLRAELLRLAEVEIETQGHEALSLRDLAVQLGVSKTAPYRHYPSREALLLALAQRGLQRLGERYLTVLATRESPSEKLRQACLSYLDFAAERPGLYRLVFASGATWQATEDAREVDPRSPFGLFERLVTEAAGGPAGSEARALAIACWAAIHGFAMLRMETGLTALGDVEAVQEAILSICVKAFSAPRPGPADGCEARDAL